jgi:hypothetical protein
MILTYVVARNHDFVTFLDDRLKPRLSEIRGGASPDLEIENGYFVRILTMAPDFVKTRSDDVFKTSFLDMTTTQKWTVFGKFDDFLTT